MKEQLTFMVYRLFVRRVLGLALTPDLFAAAWMYPRRDPSRIHAYTQPG